MSQHRLPPTRGLVRLPSAGTYSKVQASRGSFSRPAERSRDGHLAEYVADVLFIVLLAAPFVIFTAPSSELDAVLSAPPAVAAPADAPAGQPE
jgi:hypothetical protein